MILKVPDTPHDQVKVTLDGIQAPPRDRDVLLYGVSQPGKLAVVGWRIRCGDLEPSMLARRFFDDTEFTQDL
jgi:hypothetical protein